jgi:hypothetical protein
MLSLLSQEVISSEHTIAVKKESLYIADFLRVNKRHPDPLPPLRQPNYGKRLGSLTLMIRKKERDNSGLQSIKLGCEDVINRVSIQ